jgi:two-component system NarL family sensor kinase
MSGPGSLKGSERFVWLAQLYRVLLISAPLSTLCLLLLLLSFNMHQTQLAWETGLQLLAGELTLLVRPDADLRKLVSTIEQLRYLSQNTGFITTSGLVLLAIILITMTGIDLHRMFQRLALQQQLARQSQETERRRVAQALHDEVVQDLVDLKRSYQPEKLDDIILSIQRICHNLKPKILEDLGLAAALSFLADGLRTDAREVIVSIDSEHLGDIPENVQLVLFRASQELLQNIKKHAQASKVWITLSYHPEEATWLKPAGLRLTIRDNGKGFAPRALPKASEVSGPLGGLGLPGIYEAIETLHGHVRMTSAIGQGTQIFIFLPIVSNPYAALLPPLWNTA